MVPSIRTNSNMDGCTSSYSRAKDWNACCAQVMGLEEEGGDDVMGSHAVAEHEDFDTSVATFSLQVTNLLPADLFEDDDDNNNSNEDQKQPRDPWTENALNIQADLERMANWIQSKKWSFISFDSMRDDEASLIQSTVTSFAATTANEIESLRKMATSTSAASSNQQMYASNSNAVHHRTGIVQILFSRLKEDIVEPFGVLQKHRSRKAVSLWQNPLQCKLLVKSRPPATKRRERDEIDEALGLIDGEDNSAGSDKTEQRFMPSRESHKGRNNFMETYQQDQKDDVNLRKRPASLIRDPMSVLSSENEVAFDPHKKSNELSFNNNQQPKIQGVTTIGQSDIPNYHQVSHEEYAEVSHQQMQQEALLLQAMVTGDLDSVQKMEQQMVSITTLLTQFSELVSEQQEEVWQIHDIAKETKDNMDKGQESLVKAAEATYQSKHYMAKGIFGMGCLLLLFHWLRP